MHSHSLTFLHTPFPLTPLTTITLSHTLHTPYAPSLQLTPLMFPHTSHLTYLMPPPHSLIFLKTSHPSQLSHPHSHTLTTSYSHPLHISHPNSQPHTPLTPPQLSYPHTLTTILSSHPHNYPTLTPSQLTSSARMGRNKVVVATLDMT